MLTGVEPVFWYQPVIYTPPVVVLQDQALGQRAEVDRQLATARWSDQYNRQARLVRPVESAIGGQFDRLA